jgi:hypothetical protein
MPFQWALQHSPVEFFFSWLWMAGLTLPGGYWGAKIVCSADVRGSSANIAMVVGSAIAILGAGLILPSLALGSTPAPAPDWLGAAAGMVIGGAFAIRTRKTFAPFFNGATIRG